MILADKITEERKKLGMSQEELAEKLSVSRQAVSKWESAQSTPDLQKIIIMSELFSVSTDYLLKDDAEIERPTDDGTDTDKTVRRVSMEEANAFLETMKKQSKNLAFGVMLCILCPVTLIFLAGLAEASVGGITENVACAIGMATLFIFVAAAVFLFICYASRTERFGYLQKEIFETAYGVSGMVKEKKAEFAPRLTGRLSIGVVLCVLSPLPLIISALIHEEDLLLISMTALLLCIVAVGVYLIVWAAMIKASHDILLQEGEYRKSEKKRSKAVSAASSIYWCIATAVYFVWSFLSKDWKSTWIVWPIAGVLFAPYIMVVKQFGSEKDENG